MLLTRTLRSSLAGSVQLRGLSTSTAPLLVTPKELKSLLDSHSAEELVVLDSSWWMPNLQPPRHGFTEFKSARILGAGFWDSDIIATRGDAVRNLPHMLPSAEIFADAASRLGIGRDSHVVLYDAKGVFSSPRAAFTFKAFGHKNVSVLNGGLPAWRKEGYHVDGSKPGHINPHSTEEPKQTKYQPIFSELLYQKRPVVESYFIADIEEHMTEYPIPELDAKVVKSYDQVVALTKAKNGKSVILDARPNGRFTGKDPEPRADMSSGHMPNSLSLPFSSLLQAKDGVETLLPKEQLEKVFVDAVGKDKWDQIKQGKLGVTATCGSGMTAAVIWLGLQVATGGTKAGGVSVYDESWMGYASRKESKIVKD